MSVILYRDGEQVKIQPETLDSHLGNGYFLTREESLTEYVDEESSEESDKDIRLTAKELGISHWHVTSIEKLKVKIEAKQNGNSD